MLQHANFRGTRSVTDFSISFWGIHLNPSQSFPQKIISVYIFRCFLLCRADCSEKTLPFWKSLGCWHSGGKTRIGALKYSIYYLLLNPCWPYSTAPEICKYNNCSFQRISLRGSEGCHQTARVGGHPRIYLFLTVSLQPSSICPFLVKNCVTNFWTFWKLFSVNLGCFSTFPTVHLLFIFLSSSGSVTTHPFLSWVQKQWCSLLYSYWLKSFWKITLLLF